MSSCTEDMWSSSCNVMMLGSFRRMISCILSQRRFQSMITRKLFCCISSLLNRWCSCCSFVASPCAAAISLATSTDSAAHTFCTRNPSSARPSARMFHWSTRIASTEGDVGARGLSSRRNSFLTCSWRQCSPCILRSADTDCVQPGGCEARVASLEGVPCRSNLLSRLSGPHGCCAHNNADAHERLLSSSGDWGEKRFYQNCSS
mmetsp:Transcript_37712/g.86252  ORF Transcript_37712/g.86252 Transcript_37712/m.86252 type:complete len:204 (-) Transcript_37712:278-889(-)